MSLPYHERTCYCGEVTADRVGQTVLLTGWVDNRRDHGGMVFVDLRDRSGIVQVKFNPETDPVAHEEAGKLRSEFCIAVRGDVAPRPSDMTNPKLATGEIEVNGRELEILSSSPTPVFEIDDDIETNDETRLRYRYLDLRRPKMQHALHMRHRIAKYLRDYFDENGFYEIETPFLTRSTPEGARDYLTPSRVFQGSFFALPQSPQLFKQLLMVSGFDRYFQIVRCFRDEDLRADRQPEFTQLDVEMSFVQPDSVMNMLEGCMVGLMREIHGVDIPRPFPHITYAEALRTYGVDRPDTRYDLHITDISEAARATGFKVFTGAIERGGVVRCIALPGGGDMPRRQLDALTEEMKGIGAGGLPWVKVTEADGQPALEGGSAKFFPPEVVTQILGATGAGPGDLIFFAADSEANVCKYLAWLRAVVAERRGLIPEGQWNFLWVVDFPMFEFSAEDKRWYAVHHPFTAPLDEDAALVTAQDAGRCRAKAYDLVLNGVELGGGSIRIHRKEVQQAVFQVLGVDDAEQKEKFGFLLDALQYGAPPHGGIALGLDRLVMLMLRLDSLRDTFSFPKNQRAFCPLTQAPGEVSQKQLDELGIRLAKPAGA